MVSVGDTGSVKVCIQRASYDKIDVDALVAPLGGLKSYISSGDRVVLKVNLLNASTPESAVVTHPRVVGAVAQAVMDAGGVPVIGDSPGGKFSERRLNAVYKSAGLLEVSAELGVELNFDTRVTRVEVPDGRRVKKTQVCSFVHEADVVIGLPKLKTHSLTMLTLAMKIMYGVIPGLLKARYHSKFIRRESFSDMLVDLLAVTAADLYILDGVVGMQGDGPASGEAVDIGVMMAGVDPVAIDLGVCQLLGVEPMGVPTLKRAKIRGLWPEEIVYPLLSPDECRYEGFELPSTAGYLLTGKKQPTRVPVPVESCTACGLCEEVCPVSAIVIPDKIAVVDYKKCIRCYCCHEVCPYKAIVLKRR